MSRKGFVPLVLNPFVIIFGVALVLLTAGYLLLYNGAQDVDWKEYGGVWYAYASYDHDFERGCVCTNATYTLAGDSIEVLNQCEMQLTGMKMVAKGSASIIGDGVLLVKFEEAGLPGLYKVLSYHGGWAVVGSVSDDYLWLLTREQFPSNDVIDAVINEADVLGYDVSKLLLRQEGCA